MPITHGFKDTQKAIEARLKANYSTTPIKYENVNFREISTSYVAIVVRSGEGTRITLGDEVPLTRFAGLIIIQCFSPEGGSTLPAMDLADEVALIFNEARFSVGNSGTIRCRVASAENLGVIDGWVQVNVTIPFNRERQS